MRNNRTRTQIQVETHLYHHVPLTTKLTGWLLFCSDPPVGVEFVSTIIDLLGLQDLKLFSAKQNNFLNNKIYATTEVTRLSGCEQKKKSW